MARFLPSACAYLALMSSVLAADPPVVKFSIMDERLEIEMPGVDLSPGTTLFVAWSCLQ